MRLWLFALLALLAGCEISPPKDLYPAELDRVSKICNRNDGIEKYVLQVLTRNGKVWTGIVIVICNDGASFNTRPSQ